MKKFFVLLITLSILMVIVPAVETATNASVISSQASAATISTYTRSDLHRLIDRHGKFVAKYGSNAYLYYVSSEKVMRRYVQEIQIALNFLSDYYYYGVNDKTAVDGYYGSDTKKLCMVIQKKLKVQADGYFGKGSYSATVAKLQQILESHSKPMSKNTLSAEKIYINQYDFPTSKACTLASCGMLMRSYSLLNNLDPNAITINALWKKGWQSGAGTKGKFTINGITVRTQGISNSKGCKNDPIKTAAYLNKLLSVHEEGLVIYCWRNDTRAEHAVYLAADTSNGYKIIDPAGKAKYIPLTESANWISREIGNVSQIWYIGELGD